MLILLGFYNMIKNYSSPQRTQKSSKATKEHNDKSPKQRNDLKLTPRSKQEIKRLSKSYKENPNSKSGNIPLVSALQKSPKFHTEASDSSIKYKDSKSMSKSPKANLTDLFQYSQESNSRLVTKTSASENKSKSLKTLKNKLLAKIKRKESIGKTQSKGFDELSKHESAKQKKPEKPEKLEKPEKPEKLEKKTSRKPQLKINLKKSKSKKLKSKKSRHHEGDEASFHKNKETILKKLSDLHSRINTFRLDAILTCQNSLEQIHRAATKIQANIRGFLVRKVFSHTLKRLKENRLKEIEMEKLKKKHIDTVEKELYKIQLKSLMEMRENDLQEVSDLLKGCENLGHIKRNLEEIINRRYMVLSQTMGSIHLEKSKTSPIKIISHEKTTLSPIKEDQSEKSPTMPPFQSKDTEKTPKKQMNILDTIFNHNDNSYEEFLPRPPLISKPSALPTPSLCPSPIAAKFVQINEASERLKQKRVIYELEVDIFHEVYEEILIELAQEYEKTSLILGKTKVPIRHFNIFSSTVKHFLTDKESLMRHLNRTLSDNNSEKIIKKIKKYWSNFNLIFKLDDFLLEKYRNFSYFLQSNSVRGDKIKKIYRNFEIDVFNEALSLSINETVPKPWIYKFGCEVNFDFMVREMKKILERWIVVEAGKIPDASMLSCTGALNEDILQTSRENNLEKIVALDMKEENELWVDLKYHETGLVLCLEDDILVDLIMEVAYLS